MCYIHSMTKSLDEKLRELEGKPPKRIEYLGKTLRVSRTGGVSVRTQKKIAGVNVTANSSHGIRVSKGIAKGTSVAMQNGNFQLKGRYEVGDGTHLNVSKSGFSLSQKTDIGTFNMTNPNRSSVNVGGIQLRGKKAARVQEVFLVFQLVGLLFKLVFWVFKWLVMGVVAVLIFLLLMLNYLFKGKKGVEEVGRKLREKGLID